MGYVIIFILGLFFGWLANSVTYTIQNYNSNHQSTAKNKIKNNHQTLINTANQPIKNKIQTKKPINLVQQLEIAWNQNNHQLAAKLVEKLKNNHNYEPVYLWVSSNILGADKKFISAINKLSDLFMQNNIKYPQQKVKNKILILKNQYLNKNKTPEDLDKRIEMLQKVSDLLPEDIETHYQLVIAMIAKSDFYQAKNHLNYLQNNPYWNSKANKLKQQIINAQRFNAGEIKIPLIYTNNSWILMANINNNKPIKLLIDTGANLTIIKQKFVNNDDIVNLSNQQRIVMSTVAGEAYANKVVIKNLKIGEVNDENFVIATTKNNQLPSHVDGLLGTDWLNRFEFIIDKKRKFLLLKP